MSFRSVSSTTVFAATAAMLLVVATAAPAFAGQSPSKKCFNSNGQNVGTVYGHLSSGAVSTDETFGECGTVRVQGLYYGYQGGPQYYSAWYTGAYSAAFSHSYMARGYHKADYVSGTFESWF